MPLIIRDLPVVTFSSGATASPSIGAIDDATTLGIFLSTVVTATGTTFTVQVEPSDTGVNFLSLQPGNVGTTAISFLATQFLTIANTGFRQIRLSATGAVNNGLQVQAVKQITV